MSSPVRLSVTFVRPTQAIEIIDNICTPCGTLAICRHPGQILRRSSQGNPSSGEWNTRGVAEYTDFGPIERYIHFLRFLSVSVCIIIQTSILVFCFCFFSFLWLYPYICCLLYCDSFGLYSCMCLVCYLVLRPPGWINATTTTYTGWGQVRSKPKG